MYQDTGDQQMISVLYVDDDETFCRFFTIALEKMGGFTVTTVRSGHEAVDMILSGQYDIVVSDYHMPGMNGIDLLKKYQAQGSSVPFILFTGKGREEVVIEAINNGAAFYLQKGGDTPSQFAELAHKIRQAVTADNAMRALKESEEKFRLLFETARDGIVLIKDQIIQDGNPQIATMLGTDREHLIGSTILDWSAEKQSDNTYSIKKIHELLGTVDEYGSIFAGWRCIRANKTTFDAEVSISRIEIKGEVIFQAIIRDITDRLRAEQELEMRNIDLSAAYEELLASGDELRARLEDLRISQAELKESEQKYRELADLLPEGVFECTLEGNITYVNHQAFRIFGFEPDTEIVGMNIFRFIIPEDQERAMERIRFLIREHQMPPAEYRAVRKDGSVFPVIIHSSLAFHDGKPSGVRGVIIDISERKKAEEAVLESQQQLSDVIEFLPDATFVINSEGVVIMWNRAMADLTGLSSKEILGKGNYEYAFPFYGKRRPILVDYALHPDTLNEGMYDNLAHKGDVIIGEISISGMGDGVRHLWIKASPLRNASGEVIGGIESIRDITSRKEAEEALLRAHEDLEKRVYERTKELVLVNQALTESEERYRVLVELSPDAIMVHDGGRLLFVNPAGLKLVEAESEDDVLHRSPLDFVHPDYHPLVKARIERAMEDGSALPVIEEKFVSLQGNVIDVEVSSMPIRYQDAKGVLVVVRDISLRKAADAQLKEYAKILEDKNNELDHLTNRLLTMNQELDARVRERTEEVNQLLKQKDDFINQLGHDLKTPLTPLIALLPNLLTGETDPERKGLITVLLRSVYSIRDQIDKMLTLARIGHPDIKPCREPVYPASIINQAIDKNWLFIQKKNLRVQMLVPEGLKICFSGRDIQSVFDNLISNAIKYTKSGGSIRVIHEMEDDMICFSVDDTGIGLTAEEAARVFDEFYMVDPSRHDRQSSGLGLAIVKRIVELYGGYVRVESEGKEKGSRFTICLPHYPDSQE